MLCVLIGYMEVKMSWHLVRWPGKLKLAFVSESVLVFVPPQSSLSAFRLFLQEPVAANRISRKTNESVSGPNHLPANPHKPRQQFVGGPNHF